MFIAVCSRYSFARTRGIINNSRVRLCSSSTLDDKAFFNTENPFEKEKPKCVLCKYNISPDFRNVRLLSQFQSPYTGKMYGSHITGLCKAKQEQVEREARKAQNCGLMPSYHKDPKYLNDPSLFSPENPIRPHNF